MGLVGANSAATYVRGRDKASEKLKLLPFVKVADARRRWRWRWRPCQAYARLGVLTLALPRRASRVEEEQQKSRVPAKVVKPPAQQQNNNMGNGKWQREPLEHFVLPTFRRARKTQVRFGDATPRVFALLPT